MGAGAAKLLLSMRADPHIRDSVGFTVMHQIATVKANRPDLFELTLDSVEDPEQVMNAADRRGMTALHHALGSGKTGAAKILLSRRAVVNSLTNRKATPLAIA